MRIAISGTHRVGKTTLAEELADALDGYELLDEPYWALVDEGYELADPPTAEDFEAQLRRSITDVGTSADDVVFDRCPVDVLAYLEADGHDAEPWLDQVLVAMRRLDLVVHVPVETPDRVIVGAGEDCEQRAAVDEVIARLLLDEHLADEVLTVSGTVDERLAQVLSHIEGSG
jgi:predicted ATPase